MAVIGTRAIDSEAAADLAAREPGILSAAGIHPNDVHEAEPDEWDRIERLVSAGRAAAVGETGLDWYRDSAPRELQREYFDRHVRLAQRFGLPLVVHTRESIRDVLTTLRDAISRGPLTVVLHAFTGSSVEAAEAVDDGDPRDRRRVVVRRRPAQVVAPAPTPAPSAPATPPRHRTAQPYQTFEGM